MSLRSCLSLSRAWRTTRYTRHICTAFPASPVPGDDLPRTAGEADARSARAEQLLSPPSGIPDASAIAEAYRLARESASAGCARGKTVQGGLLLQGVGDDADAPRMRDLLESAANAGDPWGMLTLANALLEESRRNEVSNSEIEASMNVDESGAVLDMPGVEPTTPAALVRAKRKARRRAGFSDGEAQEYEQHLRILADDERDALINAAESWMLAAADRGLDAAMVSYANRLLERGMCKDAVEWYERAIEATRNTDAYYNLGMLLTDGAEGVAQDNRRAYKCFSMAAQLGDSAAQAYMGALLRGGTFEQEPDAAAARTYIELAAAQRNPFALYMLAGLHRAGEGGLDACEKTYLRYLTMSSEAGYSDAIAELADLNYKGECGVDQNFSKALTLFKQAGALGNADAMCSAAAMIYNGRGHESDKHEAFLLYQEAALLGSHAAMRNIGAMYFKGDGVPKNVKLAETFFQMADDKLGSQMEESRQFENTPIRITDAPAHPMADVPRNMA